MSKIAERYGKARRSSHLKMDEHPGDTDVLVAAGWANVLGTVLLSCKDEWDNARASIAAAEADTSTSRVLMLMKMRSLKPAAQILRYIAGQRVTRKSLALQPIQVAHCVGFALDIWLDQRCESCSGRGFSGGYGSPVITCRKCRGTGKRRRDIPSKLAGEIQLAEWLIAEIERFVSAAERKVHRALK